MDNKSLFNNLQALEDASFPKECNNCSLVYLNEKEYIQKTVPYEKKPELVEDLNEQGDVYLKLVRRCPCGQPILDHFGDRRDQSKQGEIRRRAFQKVVDSLQEKGLSAESARQELLNHMKNKGSKVLESLGIF